MCCEKATFKKFSYLMGPKMQRILTEHYFLKNVIDALCRILRFSSFKKCVNYIERYKIMGTVANH